MDPMVFYRPKYYRYTHKISFEYLSWFQQYPKKKGKSYRTKKPDLITLLINIIKYLDFELYYIINNKKIKNEKLHPNHKKIVFLNELRIVDPQSPIPNPQSPIPKFKFKFKF